MSAFYFIVQITVGGGYDTHIYRYRFLSADSDDLPLFQHTEQFNLCIQGKFSHFVEKQCPAVCPLESTRLCFFSIGKGTAFMAE